MPTTTPRDRFDDVPAQRGRVGAHRAENPHMNGLAIFLWAAAATVILVAVGIFGTLYASGRITLFPEPTPTPTPTPEVTPIIDTSYNVLVLNATPEDGLAGRMADTIIAAGWKASKVTAGEAGATDFETTTVYYAFPEDEAAAAGLAEVVGGAEIEQNEQYLPPDDPNTDEDESDVKQLTVVLGLDQIEQPDPSPSG